MASEIRSSASGSLILMGEHAVLHGRLCLVTALNRRLTVTLTERSDTAVRVQSTLGEYTTDIEDYHIESPFTFLLTALDAHRTELTRGLDIHIASDISSTTGLGSSAAVTVALHAGCTRLRGLSATEFDLFDLALQTVRKVQGMGSGADVAASIWGGTVAYRDSPFSVEPLGVACPLTVVYSGSKMKTPDVVTRVDEARGREPEAFERLFDIMELITHRAAGLMRSSDWSAVGALMNVNQGLLDALGVNNLTLSEIVYALRAQPGIFGSKISGSGLGDCVVGLGEASGADIRHEVIDVQASLTGVVVEQTDGS